MREVEYFFRENFSREAGFLARRFVEALSAKIVARQDILEELKTYRGKIKERALENLAAIKHEKIEYLVAYDEDYPNSGVEEYITPREFVQLFGLKPYEVEY